MARLRLIPALAALTAATALAIGGCGDEQAASSGDAASVTVTTSSLSKAQFLKQANAACKGERIKLPSRILAFEERAGGGDISERYTGLVKAALLPTIEGEVEKVQTIGAPAGAEEDVEEMLSAQLTAVDEAKKLENIKFPDGLQSYFAEPRQLMEGYGLSECSINFTLSPANAAAAEG